jgi:hypothetical protein
MLQKLRWAAATAAAACIFAAVALHNDAATANFRPNFKWDCYPQFKKLGGGTSYICHKGFIAVCKTGLRPTKPTLTNPKKNVWYVRYSCSPPPK